MRKIKRFAAIILSLCMMLAGSMTAFAAEGGQQPEQPALVGASPRSFILPDYEDSFRYVKGDEVHLRAEPSLSGAIVGKFYSVNRPWVILSGEAEIADGYTWLKVTSSSVNASGWIAKDFVQ